MNETIESIWGIEEQPKGLQFSGTTGRSKTNNNPLNLEFRPGSYQDKYGAELEPQPKGGSKPRFAKFKSMEDGYRAGLDQIALDQSKGHTLKSFVEKFAPRHENPTSDLIRQYAKATGAKADTPLSQIPADKLIVPMLARESSTKVSGSFLGPSSAEAATMAPTEGFNPGGPPVVAPQTPEPIPQPMDESMIERKMEATAATVKPQLPSTIDDIWGGAGEGVPNTQPIQPTGQVKPGQVEDIWGAVGKPGQLVPISGPEEVNDPHGFSWKDLAIDTGLMIGALGAVSVAAPAAGVLATGMLTGIAYGVTKEGLKALGIPIGGKHESMLGIESPIGKIAEDAILFGALDVAGKAVGGLAKHGFKTGTKEELELARMAKLVEKGIKPTVGEKAWDVVSLAPDKLSIGGKTITEHLQPAIERIRTNTPEAGEVFREARTMQSLSKKAGGEFVEEVKKLNFSERAELLRGGENLSPKVQGVVDKFDAKLVQTTEGRYQEAFVNQLEKTLKEPLSAIEEMPEAAAHHLEALDDLLAGRKSNVKEMHRALDGLIRDITVSDKIKVLARDLYDLPASLPGDIAKASNKATEEHILSGLIKTPNVISSEAKPGYVQSKHSAIKGMYIDKDIELELSNMKEIQKEVPGWYQKWFLPRWKTSKVTMSPRAHIGHIIGRGMLNDCGGFPIYRWDVYAEGLWNVAKAGPSFKEWNSIVGLGTTFGKEEIGQLTKNLRYGATTFEKLINLFDRVVAPSQNLYAAEESWFKVSKYIWNRKQGMDKIEAALDSLKWTFNYGEVTPLIRKVRSSPVGIPFITFQSKVLPILAETAVKHPLRLAKWGALGIGMTGYALNQIGMSYDEWNQFKKILPDYLKGPMKIPMPYRGEDGALRMMDFGWLIPGLREVSQLQSYGYFSPFIQSPAVGLVASLAMNRKHSKVPIYYDWEEPVSKAMKMISHIWQNLSPSLAPGNYDWNALHDSLANRPGALSPWEAVAAQFGMRMISVDEGGMIKRHKALQRIHEAEATMEMRRDLRRSGSDKETRDIIEKWQKGVQGIKTEGLSE